MRVIASKAIQKIEVQYKCNMDDALWDEYMALPAKPALHISDPLSTTNGVTSETSSKDIFNLEKNNIF